MDKPSVTVTKLANLASRGKYDNVTPPVAKQMNELFVEVAALINQLEEEEKELDNE